MRRSIQTLGRRLGSISIAGGLAGAPGSSAGLLAAAADGAIAASGVCAARPATAAAASAAGWPRSLSYHDGGDDGGTDGGSREWRQRPARRGPPPPDPDSDMGRLLACENVAEMRAWREEVEAEGRFDASQLSAVIRRLGLADGLNPQERNAFMSELLDAVAQGSMAVDGKAAVYLVWLPAKRNWRGDEASLQAVLPVVYAQLEGMQTNDLSTLLWAMGRLRISPADDVRELLYDKLQELLPHMNLKELTATGFGVSKLRMPPDVAAPLVPAIEAQLPARLHRDQAERLLKLVPYLPGLHAESIMTQRVFDALAHHANRVGLYTLSEAVWAATRVGHRYQEADMQRILDAVQRKLGDNRGPEVQTLLASLSTVGWRAGDGPLTYELIEQCVASQMEVVCGGNPRPKQADYLSKFLVTLSALHAHVPEETLVRALEFLQAAGLGSLSKPWQLQMAFRRLGHQPGVDALEPLTGHNTAMKEKQQTVRQSRQAAELEQAEEQGEEVVEEPQAAVEEPQAAVEEPQAAVEEPQAAVEEPQALATEAVAEEEAAAR